MQIHNSMTGVALAAWLTATTAVAQSAPAGQPIHHCIGAHGEIVFSGLACAAGTTANEAAPGIDTTAPILPTNTCPASSAALRDRISAAVARHDPNALGGLLRWRGVGASAANARLRALRDLVKRPLLALDSGDSDSAADGAAVATTQETLRVRTGSNEGDGVREHRFGVDVDGACYWLVW